MNLKEIRQEINSALDYNPDIKQYDDSISRVINRHYLQVSSQYQWLFMQERKYLMLRADIVAGTEDTATTDGSRIVSLPTTLGAGVVNLPEDIVGQTFFLNNEEYKITARHDARTFVVDKPIAAASNPTWTIKYLKYPMPRDTVEVLGIMDRGFPHTEIITFDHPTDQSQPGETTTKTTTGPDRGRFIFLDARKEEYLYLDREDTGDPFVSIEEMHANLQPPDFAPVLEQVAASGSPTDTVAHPIRGATYEYCYTFQYAGMESPPSPITEISAADSSTAYTEAFLISKLMDTRAHRLVAEGKSGITGMVKKIYRRVSVKPVSKRFEGVGKVKDIALRGGMGPWRHIATVAEDITEFTDDCDELTTNTVVVAPGEPFISADPSGTPFDLDRLNDIGPRQYLRFWYTPNSDYKVEVRYHRRPLRLVNDNDAPEWPVQYHHYLVYASLRDICMQHGMLQHSELYDGRANQLMERMKSKYLSRTDRMYVRRGFDRAMADRERWGIPSKS